MSERVLISWSGGKDASLALYEVLQDTRVTVDGLLTTVSATTGRTSMHGLRPAVIAAQAHALDLPIEFVEIPGDGSNEAYDRAMSVALENAAERGIDSIVFADIELEDVRAYREEQLGTSPVDGRWPLWGRETDVVANSFLNAGFRATIVVVDGEKLPPSVVGRELTPRLIVEVLTDVDPSGEHGEFHTVVWGGPLFRSDVSLRTGRRVTKELAGTPYHYVDMLPGV